MAYADVVPSWWIRCGYSLRIRALGENSRLCGLDNSDVLLSCFLFGCIVVDP
jgi:hypothetical protein